MYHSRPSGSATLSSRSAIALRRATSVAACLAVVLSAATAQAQSVEASRFRSPAAQYRPTVTLDEGAGYAAPLDVAARRAIDELGAGGIMINPQGDPARAKPFDMAGLVGQPLGLLDEYPEGAVPWLPRALPGEARFGTYLADGQSGPGRPDSLGYYTPEWFAAVKDVLDMAAARGLSATFYDEVGFPSGSANQTIPAKYYRKLLRREETTVSGRQPYGLDLSGAERPLAVIAFDPSTGERVDLLALEANGRIDWQAPKGYWRVQRFYVAPSTGRTVSPDYYATADYLDREATQWFIDHSYETAHAGLSRYFGRTIRYTFFDDVGILMDEKTWHPSIDARFEQITGRPAALYYPALWEDIGPETAAARVAFYRARSEILGETFPRMLTQWANAHGARSTGHAPGNYDLQPTDTIGDPFKFYAYTDLPMADVLWGVGFARGGFKLISSVSAQRDLPQTAAEAFSVNNDANGYRRMIELFVRGFNHFITGARTPSQPRGTASEFTAWAGRSSYLLQGGRSAAEVAVVFPIESLQAFYALNDPHNDPRLPLGVHAYRDADYQAVGEMLMSELHRDFTFVHPEALAGDKISVRGRELRMDNPINDERYKVVVLPGGDVLSVPALAKIKAFWDAGGAVIATSLLPSRSAEFGRDAEVRAMVAEMFGADPSTGAVRRNAAGGRAVFVPKPDAEKLSQALAEIGERPDVAFSNAPLAPTGNGVFGYTHRQRDGQDIYYFGNSGDSQIETVVTLKGRLTGARFWNPHDGTTRTIPGLRHRQEGDGTVTEFALNVPALSSLAVVGVRR